MHFSAVCTIFISPILFKPSLGCDITGQATTGSNWTRENFVIRRGMNWSPTKNRRTYISIFVVLRNLLPFMHDLINSLKFWTLTNLGLNGGVQSPLSILNCTNLMIWLLCQSLLIKCVTFMEKPLMLCSSLVSFFVQIVLFDIQYLIIQCNVHVFSKLLSVVSLLLKVQQQMITSGIQLEHISRIALLLEFGQSFYVFVCTQCTGFQTPHKTFPWYWETV